MSLVLWALPLVDGRHPCGDLRAGPEAELRQDVLHMALGRPLRDNEFGSDLTVRQTSGDEGGNFELPRAQAVTILPWRACPTSGSFAPEAHRHRGRPIEALCLSHDGRIALGPDRSSRRLLTALRVLPKRFGRLPRDRSPNRESRSSEPCAALEPVVRGRDPGKNFEGQRDAGTFIELAAQPQGLELRSLRPGQVLVQPGTHPETPEAVRPGPGISPLLRHR